jgi:DNA-binding SARP family transcriptional activator
MPATKPPGTPDVPVLHLLGGIAITGIPEAAGDRLLAQRKVVGLLAYLSMMPAGRLQSRDKLVGLLWPELTQSHARAALRKACMAVRDALGNDPLDDASKEQLKLDRTLLSCDASQFEQLAAADRITGALELYQGPFMPGFNLPGCAEFGIWVDETRGHLAQRASAITWALALNLEANKQLTKAGRKARDAIKYQWSDERLLRATMKLLVRIGDRAGALKAYEDSAHRMFTELEAEPSSETVALAEAIKKGQPIS